MQEKLILKNGEYKLKDTMTYPNGGTSYFYVHDDQMIVIDDNICNITDQDTRFDYSLITDKQNNYMKQYAKLFRFLKSDIDTIDDVLDISEKNDGEFKLKSTVNRENNAETSPLEWNFEKNFADVYGRESLKYLWKEYGISDWQGNNYFLDYFIHAKSGDIAVEENGVKTFLVVFSTASGKSKIIEEDIKEFSEKYDRFKALILVPNTNIIDDWKAKINSDLYDLKENIEVKSFAYMVRNYSKMKPDAYKYIVVDDERVIIRTKLEKPSKIKGLALEME